MKEKKQYHTLRLLLGLLPAAALWSCTQDEFPSTVAAEEEGARLPLTVQVADAGFVSDGDLSTRTMDVGYKTTFTVGDSIGGLREPGKRRCTLCQPAFRAYRRKRQTGMEEPRRAIPVVRRKE